LDLLAACTPSGCHGKHDTDIGIQAQADSFTYAAGSDAHGAFGLASLGVNAPLACSEIDSTGTPGAGTGTRFAPAFANASPGGQLEFNAGGPTIVDLSNFNFDGTSPAGVTASYNNYGTPSLPPMVTCYQINPVTGGPIATALGPYGIFRASFEDHASGEPWLSVQTVNSPNARTTSTQSHGPTSTTTMAYVVQVHNASSAVGWRLSLGYDQAFFDAANNGGISPQWCVLGSNIPQPGSTSGTATCGFLTQEYTLGASDVQAATNSIYVYVDVAGSPGAASGWSGLNGAMYPAVAAIFPPFDTYPLRFDDKSVVATGNNLPKMNIGQIVCANDRAATSCTLYDPDGYPVPNQVKFQNSVNSDASASFDPLVYFVDPYGGTTLPGNAVVDAVTVSNVSCSDPNNILVSPLGVSNFPTSSTALGALQLGFSFKTNGSLYVAGTASCTAKFTAANYAPALSTTESFTITMLPAQASHFSVSASASATAGSATNFTVTALDAGNNTVTNYSGTVHFTSSDGLATLPADSNLTAGVGTFGATLKSAGSSTITATDKVNAALTGTSGAINVSPAAATRFRVNAQATATMGSSFQISVTALDPYNNTDTNYGGTVHFTSSDGAATLPADMGLTFGVATPSITFNTMGTQTVTATDTGNSSINGTSAGTTVN
jgi:hypothetical protein